MNTYDHLKAIGNILITYYYSILNMGLWKLVITQSWDVSNRHVRLIQGDNQA